MFIHRRRAVLGAALATAVAMTVSAPANAGEREDHPRTAGHVLLISVDGMHESDLTWYAAVHPASTLAALVRGGTHYTHAMTPIPSDSFPGLIAQVTGGNPKTTGVYYDDSFNRALLPAGTTTCKGATAGAEVAYTEGLDRDPASIDAGQGLPGLPSSILKMTGSPRRLIDPAKLPVDPKTCRPVYPHSYLKVNTVFDVIAAHGKRTAWSDKHPAYEILNGPSGRGVDDLFTPEINSDAIGFGAGQDWTNDNAATAQYDSYKVAAVLNEIDGYDHGRSHRVGMPALLGLNFQTVSTAEKLPTSNGLTGGYLSGGRVPGPLLTRALDFIDASVGAITTELYVQGHGGDTTIVLSAKHAQSPTDPATLSRIPDGPIIDAINNGWRAMHPKAADLVAFAVDDDIMLMWLSDRGAAANAFVRGYLLGHPGVGNDINGNPKTLPQSGLRAVYAGPAAASYFGVSVTETRHPDIVGIVTHGVVYTGGKKKIAEHGGTDPQDRNVPLLVVGPGVARGVTVNRAVGTTQIAPTILTLLHLNPGELKAVRAEHTRVLPGIRS